MTEPWIDISLPIQNGAPQWPADPPIRLSRLCEIGGDCPVQITQLDFLSHFLTHVDAPAHLVPGGHTVDSLPLDVWSGEALVVEVADDVISERYVPECCAGLCVLFKTRSGALWDRPAFVEDYVAMTHEAAVALAMGRAKLVGVDYMSVDPFASSELSAHRTLLGSGIPILEGADLREIEPGAYELVAFPLKIIGCDGSPVRAALRRKVRADR